jgi:hypothetical protein
MQRAGQAAGAGADDEDVRFKSFALDGHAGILADGRGVLETAVMIAGWPGRGWERGLRQSAATRRLEAGVRTVAWILAVARS